MNELATVQPAQPQSGALNALVPKTLDEALRLADTMSKANLVPSHLQGKPGDCFLVVSQAQRWGLDAISVAQATSVVHGRLCYEGKLVAAVLYAMGAVEGRLRYKYEGEGPKRTITVTGRVRGTDEDVSITGSVADWRTYGKDKQGSPIKNAWDSMADDMLAYRGARQWARRYAPEAMLGIYTPDEIEEAPQRIEQVAPSNDLMPKAKSEAVVTPVEQVVDAKFVDVPRAEDSGATIVTDLTPSMLNILTKKAEQKGVSLSELTEQFGGSITKGNINDVLASLK